MRTKERGREALQNRVCKYARVLEYFHQNDVISDEVPQRLSDGGGIDTIYAALFRGDAVMRASRAPDILADAAHAIFLKDAKTFTGNFLIDDTFLFSNGVRDFDRYRVDPGVDLEPDFFVCQTTRHRRSA